MPNFASLEPQDVRDYWMHEEYEFTPWIANEIDADEPSQLENTLAIDLEVIEQEKSVGKFKVDIYAREVSDGRTVIIENQLEDSDHDHLGKAIAYAAGVDADLIVWIAPEFNDEHLDAIEWLNSNSREGIDLFAVRIEVWRIGDSAPAVRFNSLESPSEWKQKAKRSGGELSSRDKLREEFWTAFRDCIKESDTPLKPRKPRPRHYYPNPIGIGGYHVSFHIDEDAGTLGLQLIITDSEEAYNELRCRGDEIEEELQSSVEWGELRETRSGKMRSDLSVSCQADIEERESWDEYFEWMLDQGERFHEVFGERIREIENS